MAMWLDRINRIRLAGMGLTQHLYTADWARWLAAMQDKGCQFQADATDVGQAIVSEATIVKPFAIRPLYQAVGAVDLAFRMGRQWFKDMVAEGRALRGENKQAGNKRKRGSAGCSRTTRQSAARTTAATKSSGARASSRAGGKKTSSKKTGASEAKKTHRTSAKSGR